MKKVLCLVFTVLLCLAVSAPAFAEYFTENCAYITEITAHVKRKSGADFCSYADAGGMDDELRPNGTKIPYKTELILWESAVSYDSKEDYESGGTVYYHTSYKGEEGYVRAGDLELDLTPVDPDEGKFCYSRYVVINSEGANLYEGPRTEYDIVKTLPYGTEAAIKFYEGYGDEELSDGGFAGNTYSEWSYTEVDGAGGWIHTGALRGDSEGEPEFGKSVAFKDIPCSPLGTAYVINDTFLYDKLNWAERESIAEIPAGTGLKFDIFYNFKEGNTYIYTEYDGKEGWVSIDSTFREDTPFTMAEVDGWLMITESLELYDPDGLEPGDATGEYIDPYQIVPYDLSLIIPTDENAGAYYENYETWYRITADDGQYWVYYDSSLNGEPCEFRGETDYRISDSNGIDYYAEPDDDAEPLGKTAYGELVCGVFELDRNAADYDPDISVDYDVDEYYEYGEDDYNASGYDDSEVWFCFLYNDEFVWAHPTEGLVEKMPSYKPSVVSLADKSQIPDPAKVIIDPEPPMPELVKKSMTVSIAGTAVITVLAAAGIIRARRKKPE